jgi:hypothetical protein
MTARPVLAAVAKQTLANIFPNRMRAVQFHSVEPPYLSQFGSTACIRT